MKKPKNKKTKLVGTEGMDIFQIANHLVDKNISYILNEITETDSKELFLNVLKDKGIYKGSLGIKLSPDIYSEIKEQLISILSTNKKRDRSKKIQTNNKIKANKSISKSNTVYDKIKTMNGTGKIIYIRSK